MTGQEIIDRFYNIKEYTDFEEVFIAKIHSIFSENRILEMTEIEIDNLFMLFCNMYHNY